MKRNVSLTVLLFAAFGPILGGPILGGPALFAQARNAAPSGGGFIKQLAGTVEIKRPGEGAFTPAKALDAVAMDTVISTGFHSIALVSLGSSLITVKPLTMLTLAAISAQAAEERIELRLHAGRVRVDVKPPEGFKTDLTVGSSFATTSVRGTSFEFDTRNLYVSEGTVAFRGTAGGTRRLRAGDRSVVDDAGKAEDPLAAAAAELNPAAPAGIEAGRTPEMPVTDVEFIITLMFY